MTYQMTVSPDFAPEYIAGWYIFNTWLQKQLGENIHLELYPDFESQREAIRNGRVDIIYANPFDASMLIREKGFTALARPSNKADEAVVVVHAKNQITAVEELPSTARVASTDDPDVHLMGMMMLEPADLDASNTERQVVDSYILVAKHLIRGEADVGFFLKESFDNLSNFTKEQLRVLVESQISLIYHSFLVGPRLAAQVEQIRALVLNMHTDPKGAGVLKSLNFEEMVTVEQEDAEFMIDLMDTLG